MESELEMHGLDNGKEVFFYEQDFYVLSNFSAFAVIFNGPMFPTSEAAYHWQKFTNAPEVQRLLFDTRSAHDAFKVAEAHKTKRRKDWDAVKVPIMKDILRAKVAQHEYVRRKLLATGDRTLIENSWRDDFWGWGADTRGHNMLGKLWMEVRAELRAASDAAAAMAA